jgi:hypothetical protein
MDLACLTCADVGVYAQWLPPDSVPDCISFRRAITTLIPGIFASNINCTVDIQGTVSVDIYTVSVASVAVISFLKNITTNVQLAASVNASLFQFSAPPAVVFPCQNAICPNATCMPGDFEYVPEGSCCPLCESLVMQHYRLDYGIYLLRLREYVVASKLWTAGMFI